MEIAKAMELLAQQRIPIKLNIAGEIDEQNPGALNGHEFNFIRNQPNISLVGFVDDMPLLVSVPPSNPPFSRWRGRADEPDATSINGTTAIVYQYKWQQDICVDGKNGFLAKPDLLPILPTC